MKTSTNVFFVLVLTLVVVPLIAEAEEVANDELCATLCANKTEPTINNNCKESCGVIKRANLVFFESVTCLGKCTQFDNVPAMKSCEEGCQKEYNAKAAEVTSSCNEVCSKAEKDPHGIESCKKDCTLPPNCEGRLCN